MKVRWAVEESLSKTKESLAAAEELREERSRRDSDNKSHTVLSEAWLRVTPVEDLVRVTGMPSYASFEVRNNYIV